MSANIARLAARTKEMGVTLRPHIKTAKSLEIVRRLVSSGSNSFTVSTLAEAEALAGAGITDVLYALDIAPQTLPRVAQLRRGGCNVSLILDSKAQTDSVSIYSLHTGDPISTLL